MGLVSEMVWGRQVGRLASVAGPVCPALAAVSDGV